jgi:hypothetical protein
VVNTIGTVEVDFFATRFAGVLATMTETYEPSLSQAKPKCFHHRRVAVGRRAVQKADELARMRFS